MKNNSSKALPPKRTIGSVVRKVAQQRDEKQSTVHAATTSAANTGEKNTSNNKINISPVCDICAQNVPGPEREKIYAFGKCDHHVCYVCSARLRAICDQQECPICREKLASVIFSANKTKSFDSYDLKNYHYDDNYRIYFENDKIRAAFEKLLNIECLECLKRIEKSSSTTRDEDIKNQYEHDTDSKKQQDANSTSTSSSPISTVNRGNHKNVFPSVQRLKSHLDIVHKLKLCDLCLKHNKLFPFEYSYYNIESLRKHTLEGEPKTSHRGHPKCKLCRNIFFNLDELIQHMSREHFHCHLCGRHNTTQHIYFIDYPSLRNHFKTKHFLCERDHCRHEQFTSAFDTQVDYQLHLVQVHENSHNLSRGESRQQRTITLESASHRLIQSNRQENLPSNAAIVTTGTLATANDPRRQIPESIQAQIRQQRLPSRSEFPALGGSQSSSFAISQNVSQQVLSSQGSMSSGAVAGPSSSGVSFVRSLGGCGRTPDQLSEMDFPPLPERPKKPKSGNKSKNPERANKMTNRHEEMTLDQLISSNLTLSARNNRANNKPAKSTKHRPIKIQL